MRYCRTREEHSFIYPSKDYTVYKYSNCNPMWSVHLERAWYPLLTERKAFALTGGEREQREGSRQEVVGEKAKNSTLIRYLKEKGGKYY